MGMSLTYQLVPGLAPGVDLDVDGRITGPLRFIVGMQYVPEQRTAQPTADFGFGVTAAKAGACVMAESARLSGAGCATLSLGAIHAVVYQPRPTAPGDRIYGGLNLSAEGAVILVGPLFLSATFTMTVPLTRYAFRVEGHDSVEFQEPLVVPQLALGIGLRFP